MVLRQRHIKALAVCALVTWGCTDARKPIRPVTVFEVEKTIGEEGGTITGPNGVKLVIPEGALAEDVDLVIKSAEPGEYPTIPGGGPAPDYVVAFLPHGTQFLKPVTITLPHGAENVNNAVLYAAADENAKWGDADTENEPVFGDTTVTTQVMHFTYFCGEDHIDGIDNQPKGDAGGDDESSSSSSGTSTSSGTTTTGVSDDTETTTPDASADSTDPDSTDTTGLTSDTTGQTSDTTGQTSDTTGQTSDTTVSSDSTDSSTDVPDASADATDIDPTDPDASDVPDATAVDTTVPDATAVDTTVPDATAVDTTTDTTGVVIGDGGDASGDVTIPDATDTDDTDATDPDATDATVVTSGDDGGDATGAVDPTDATELDAGDASGDVDPTDVSLDAGDASGAVDPTDVTLGDAGDAGDAAIDMTDGGMPDMTDGGMPDMTDGGMPDMTDGGMPDMTDGGMPDMTDGGMPDMTDGGTPDMTDVDGGDAGVDVTDSTDADGGDAGDTTTVALGDAGDAGDGGSDAGADAAADAGADAAADAGADAAADAGADAGGDAGDGGDGAVAAIYWDQDFFAGHVESLDDDSTVTLDVDDGLCVAGINDIGDVGFTYNVDQMEGDTANPYLPPAGPMNSGLNMEIATVGTYEVRLTANGVDYCASVNEGTPFIFWEAFEDCDTLTIPYDKLDPFTSVTFVLESDGSAYDFCLTEFERGA